MDNRPRPAVRAVEYEVSLLPPDHCDYRHFLVRVHYHRPRRGAPAGWLVEHADACLAPDGTWDPWLHPAERDELWLAEHTFTRDQALTLARAAVHTVTVMGRTPMQVLQAAQEQPPTDLPI